MTIERSAVMEDDLKYLSYLKGLIDIVEKPIQKGHDINISGPMETRYFLDFLYETIRRTEVQKEALDLVEGLINDYKNYKKVGET